MIVVTGASGKVGQPLVSQLQEKQLEFKAVVHSEKSQAKLQAEGVNVVRGDVSDSAFIKDLLDGAESLFLLLPSDPNQYEEEKNLIDAAKVAGVRKVVKLSAWKVEDVSVPLFQAHIQSENYLKASGLKYVILRPNAFMQNFLQSEASTIKQMSQFFNITGDHKISFIHTHDIAAVAVVALTTDKLNGRTLDLTGPEALSYEELAEKFSANLGRSVQYVNIPDEAFHQALTSNGVPPIYADGLLKLYQFYREDKGIDVTQDVSQVTGNQPKSVDDFIEENRAAFA